MHLTGMGLVIAAGSAAALGAAMRREWSAGALTVGVAYVVGFLLCLVLMPIVFMIGRPQPAYLDQQPAVIGVRQDSPAESAGLHEGDLIVALIVQRILHPCSKLAATRLWNKTTLAEELDVADADVDEVYHALDWLLDRQKRIENKLAKRHLAEGSQVRYDVSSSSYTGRTCVLACFGKNRDGIPDLPCIVYGVMADMVGRPISVDVYPGNTGDPSTVPDQATKLS